MKTRLLLALGLLTVPALAQPPELRRAPKSSVPPLTLEEANKAFGEPTRVTLHLKDTKPQDVVKEFSRVSGVAIRLQLWGDDERKKPVSLDIDNQPFWSAMRELCAVLKVAPQPYGGDSNIMLYPGDLNWMRGTAMPLSPLVSLRLSQISHTRTINLQSDTAGVVKGTSDDHSLPIQGTFLIDPKVHLLAQQSVRLTIAEAVDDKGVAMATERGYAYGQMPLMWNMQIPLNWRADMGKKLVRLRGTANCFVISKSVVWEVPDVLNAKDVKKSVHVPNGEETYTLTSVEKNGEQQYQVHLKVTRPLVLVQPDGDPETQQLFYLRRDIGRMIKLYDAKGRALRYQGGGGGDENVTAHFGTYQDDGEKIEAPQKMVFEIPLEFRELVVPFELKDLPLP